MWGCVCGCVCVCVCCVCVCVCVCVFDLVSVGENLLFCFVYYLYVCERECVVYVLSL